MSYLLQGLEAACFEQEKILRLQKKIDLPVRSRCKSLSVDHNNIFPYVLILNLITAFLYMCAVSSPTFSV